MTNFLSQVNKQKNFVKFLFFHIVSANLLTTFRINSMLNNFMRQSFLQSSEANFEKVQKIKFYSFIFFHRTFPDIFTYLFALKCN